MDRPADAQSPPRTTGGAALWVLVVQCLLALSWTLYVLFLPAMLTAAGIEKRWFVYVLIADQAIFAACDWLAGAWVDRVAHLWRRVGRTITAVTLLSSAALLSMPWVAERGNATLLLIVIFAWAATSSALRAPVFALLGRLRESDDHDPHPARVGRTGTIGVALVGISLAGAIGPYLTMLLKNVDGRLPIAVSAIALAAAGLWATRVEETLPRPAAATPGPTADLDRARRAWSLAAVVLIAAFGTQTVTAIVAQRLFQRFVGDDALLWVAWFWVGFAFGLIPGTRIAKSGGSTRSLSLAAVALLLACVPFAIGSHASTIAILAAGVALTGGAWGIFTTVVFAGAVALSDGRATARGAGTASGLLFSALAVGTLLRLGIVASGWGKSDLTVWLPEAAWLVASALLALVVRTVWRQPAALSPSRSARDSACPRA